MMVFGEQRVCSSKDLSTVENPTRRKIFFACGISFGL